MEFTRWLTIFYMDAQVCKEGGKKYGKEWKMIKEFFPLFGIVDSFSISQTFVPPPCST